MRRALYAAYLVDLERVIFVFPRITFAGRWKPGRVEIAPICPAGCAANCAKKLPGASGSSSPRHAARHRSHRWQRPSAGYVPTGVPSSDARCWVRPLLGGLSIARVASAFPPLPLVRAHSYSVHNRDRDNPCPPAPHSLDRRSSYRLALTVRGESRVWDGHDFSRAANDR